MLCVGRRGGTGNDLAQPIHVSDAYVGLAKRNDDAGFRECRENCHCQFGADRSGLGDIGDERVKREIDACRREFVQSDGRFGCFKNIRIVCRHFEQDGFDLMRIAVKGDRPRLSRLPALAGFADTLALVYAAS